MKQAQVIKKLELAVKRSFRPDVTIKNVAALRYQTRLNYFTDSSGKCGLNPELMSGHSYNWYGLVQKINERIVLNDYNYSPSTIKHVCKMRDVLRKLDVKYVELEAPRGLQNLDCAVEQEVYKYGKAIVENKYARIKLNVDVSRIKLLNSLGYKITKEMLEHSITKAEGYRRFKLDEKRIKRLALAAQAKPTLKLVGAK